MFFYTQCIIKIKEGNINEFTKSDLFIENIKESSKSPELINENAIIFGNFGISQDEYFWGEFI